MQGCALQVSFCFVVYPAVVITYLGQAAYLYSGDNNLDFDNTFYASIPTPVYWPMFVIAILAAIVASQVLTSSMPSPLASLMMCHGFVHSMCAAMLSGSFCSRSGASLAWPVTAGAFLQLCPASLL